MHVIVSVLLLLCGWGLIVSAASSISSYIGLSLIAGSIYFYYMHFSYFFRIPRESSSIEPWREMIFAYAMGALLAAVIEFLPES